MSKEEIASECTGGIFDEYELNITGLAKAMDKYSDERCIALLTYLGYEGINFERATDTPKNIYNDFKKANP